MTCFHYKNKHSVRPEHGVSPLYMPHPELGDEEVEDVKQRAHQPTHEAHHDEDEQVHRVPQMAQTLRTVTLQSNHKSNTNIIHLV